MAYPRRTESVRGEAGGNPWPKAQAVPSNRRVRRGWRHDSWVLEDVWAYVRFRMGSNVGHLDLKPFTVRNTKHNDEAERLKTASRRTALRAAADAERVRPLKRKISLIVIDI